MQSNASTLPGYLVELPRQTLLIKSPVAIDMASFIHQLAIGFEISVS